MVDPTEVREQAFQAGVKTRGAVDKVKKTANKAEEKISEAIGTTLDSAQSGFKDGIGAAADSVVHVASSVVQNPKGKRAGVSALFGLTVIAFGTVPALLFYGNIVGSLGYGLAKGQTVNSSDGLARFSSGVGLVGNKVFTTTGSAIGEAVDNAYEYKPVNNQRPAIAGNIRPGGINPYPQTPVIPIQMQQSPQVAAQPYNGNVYTPQQQRR